MKLITLSTPYAISVGANINLESWPLTILAETGEKLACLSTSFTLAIFIPLMPNPIVFAPIEASTPLSMEMRSYMASEITRISPGLLIHSSAGNQAGIDKLISEAMVNMEAKYLALTAPKA